MGIIGRMLGSEEALAGVVRGVAASLDALVYTDEEKEINAATSRSEARQMIVAWMGATQGQNLARRVIALAITGTWLLQTLVAQGLAVASVFLGEKAAAVAEVMSRGADSMTGPFMLVLGFYFAAPHMGDIAKAVTARYTKS